VTASVVEARPRVRRFDLACPRIKRVRATSSARVTARAGCFGGCAEEPFQLQKRTRKIPKRRAGSYFVWEVV
jgi:hypothetical protein